MIPDARVFISYSSRDREMAEALHRALEASGLRVWRDQTRIESNWSREIAEALVASDVVCVVWTAHAAQSPWVEHEWLTGRALGVTVLPCLLPDAPPLPKPLENIHAVVSPDVDALVTRFIERVRAMTATPTYDYTVRPDRFEVPFRPIGSFVGRAPDLLDLYLNLIGDLNNTGTRAVGLVGMGGTGKTQLVVEFAWRFAFAFTGTYWIDATDATRRRTQLIDLARRVRAPVADPETATEQQWLTALTQYCQEHPRTLLVFDNVDNPAGLAEVFPGTDFTPLALGCNLLFTTRRRFEFESSIVLQEVGMLPADSAYALLTGDHAPASAIEVESAHAIANALGYLPLALVLAAAYIRRLNRKYETYRDLLARYGLDAIDTSQASREQLATRHEAAVGRTLAEQWHAVENQNARLLFTLAGQLPEAALIPARRLDLLAGMGPGRTELQLPFEEALNDLRDLSLIELHNDRRSIALHPLVRDFSWRLVAESQRGAFRERAAERLAQAYADGAQLEREYDDRGGHDVIGDLDVTSQWLPKTHERRKKVDELRRLLWRERRNLEPEEGLDVPRPLLFQQLHHRALLMGRADPDLLRDLRDSQARRGVPMFMTRFVTTPEDAALIRVMQEDSPINGVCLLDGGARVLSASRGGALALWDVETGELLRTYLAHTADVLSVQVTIDGARALSASADRTLILWDLHTGKPLQTLRGHAAEVRIVSMTPDGRRALSADSNGQLIVWDLESGESIGDLKAPDTIFALSLSPDGAVAVSGWNPYQGFLARAAREQDLTVVLLDVDHERVSRGLPGHSGVITAIDVDWERQLALVGAHGGSTVLSSLATGETLKVFSRASKTVNAVSFVPGGRFILTGTDDGVLLLWSTQVADDADEQGEEKDDTRDLGRPIREFHGHGGPLSAIRVTADGSRAITASVDGTIIVWNLRAADKAPARHHVGNVMSVCLNGDGARALSGAQDTRLILWDVERGAPIRSFEGHRGAVARVSMSADGTRAASSSFDEGHALVWDLESGRVTHRLGIRLTSRTGRSNQPPRILSSTMSRDGRYVLTTTERRDLILWNLDTGRPRPYGMRDPVMTVALAISGDSSRFMHVWDQTQVKVWETQGRSVAELNGHTDLVWCGALSDDGRLAVTGGKDRMVIVWDVDSGRVLNHWEGHGGYVTGVALRADARRVLSSSLDKTVILWDVDSGRPLNRMVFESPVMSAAWHGDRVVLGQGGGAVSFLELRG